MLSGFINTMTCTANSTGGPVSTETFYGSNSQAVLVGNGLFVARLGYGISVNDLQAVLSAHENLFVEIIVEIDTSDVLLPRTPLTAGPYTLTGPTTTSLHLNEIHGTGTRTIQTSREESVCTTLMMRMDQPGCG